MSLPINQMALDSRGLDSLKRTAHESPDKALKTAATQFEALFMNMLLKNMRDSLPKDGLMSSSAGDTYTTMLDQQLSQNLASKGTGLADMLVKQLSRNVKPAAGAHASTVSASALASRSSAARVTPKTTSASASAPAIRPNSPQAIQVMRQATAATPATATAAAMETVKPATVNSTERKRDFVVRMSQHAKEAELKTGVPAKFMIGQAALESGWGKREIKDGSGQSAFNVFGIKATGNWSGPTVDVSTTEFVNGVGRKVVEKFRAYASYAEGFADYAKLIADNPRYANVVRTARQGIEFFAQGLQRAGYATDPAYATKLTRVINDAVQIDRQA
ncbi:MAG: flagellar assembly peptidoglycan hydrolase FlgJ [Betaproteobacteria bacterium]|nr:flagellar assembly peptidoglycan hydrolase FlgJ [Betaproteobacteria bacterium]